MSQLRPFAISTLALAFVIAPLAYSDDSPASSNPDKPRSDSTTQESSSDSTSLTTLASKTEAIEELIVELTEQFVEAFEAGEAETVANMFLEDGELIDELGRLFQGREEIQSLLMTYFETFPGTQLMVDIDSVRIVGSSIAIEEGTRMMISPLPQVRPAAIDYTVVRTLKEGKWLIASLHEYPVPPSSEPREKLESLAWLIGDWVDENPEGETHFSYEWSEDGQFIIGNFELRVAGRPAGKSSQRIGWDAVQRKIRSWTFDADGAFSEGIWTEVDNHWIVKTTSNLPDGQTGSATLEVTITSNDHLNLRSFDRIIGNRIQPDYEFTVARRPPAPQLNAFGPSTDEVYDENPNE